MEAKAGSQYRVLSVVVTACLLIAAMLSVATIAPQDAFAAGSGKTTVYVVVKKTLTESGGPKTVNTYTYNKNGLVTKEKGISSSDGETDPSIAFSYTYNNLKLKGGVQEYDSMSVGRYTFSSNAKGWTTKTVWTSASITEKFSYDSKGRVTKYDNPNINPIYYAYDSQGYVKKMREDGITYKFKYDDNGQILTKYRGKYVEYNCKNTYKNGRLMKQIAKDPDVDSYTKTVFKYKKMKVSKKAAKMVKAQQRAIITNLVPIPSAHK